MAATATHVRRQSGLDITGLSMASMSFGMKISSGVGAAAIGWLLVLGNYDASLEVQPDSAINMINLAYMGSPHSVASGLLHSAQHPP
ncbi:Na+/melibiose symporter-like transporter [Arthrobacter globiformis]|nr:Na+/melibiose symporter-like transporter [Arthrobacter globiformis]